MPKHIRQGLGSALLDLLSEQAEKMGIDSILASVSSRNPDSLKFHLKKGFRECGRLTTVGRKFGQDVDVVLLQRWLRQGGVPESNDPE